MTSVCPGAELTEVAYERSWRRGFVPLSLIIGVILISNLNALSAGFVWDDNALIVGNDFIKHWSTLPFIFTQTFLASYYRPVVMLSFAAEYALWGLRPFGFHLTNVLLHVANAIFVFMLVREVSRNFDIAFLGALLFASHPVHKGIVVIADRTGMLSAFFFLGALLLYIGYRKSGDGGKAWGKYIASVVFCGLAVFSKEETLMLPLLIIMTDLFLFPGELKRNRVRSIALCMPFFALPVLYLLARAFVVPSTGEIAQAFAVEPIRRFLTVPELLLNYLFLLIFPLNLDFDPRTPLAGFGQVWAWTALAAVLLLLAAIPWLVKRAKLIAFGVLWFLVVFIPMSNIIPIFPSIAAKELFTPIHFLYLPSVGMFLCAGCGLNAGLAYFEQKGFSGFYRRGAILGIILIIAAFSMLSFKRNSVWKNEIMLYEYIVQTHPQRAEGRPNLANAYLGAGRIKEAVEQLEVAAALNPDSAGTHNALGVAYLQAGMAQRALKEFKKSVQLEPNFADPYANMAVTYAQKGSIPEAITAGEKAVELAPSSSNRTNLGLVLMLANNLDEAENQFLNALSSNPSDAETHNALGALYKRKKEYDKAREQWEEALRLKPDYKDARESLENLKKKLP